MAGPQQIFIKEVANERIPSLPQTGRLGLSYVVGLKPQSSWVKQLTSSWEVSGK